MFRIGLIICLKDFSCNVEALSVMLSSSDRAGSLVPLWTDIRS